MQDASRMRSESSEYETEDGSRRKCKLMNEDQGNEFSGKRYKEVQKEESSERTTENDE